MSSRFLHELERRVLVFDGAMGTSLYGHDLLLDADFLGRENCTDLLVKTRPDIVLLIHEAFLDAGADAVETDTFGANRLVLGEFDEEAASWAYELNRDAARLARTACDRFAAAEKPRFVVGSMGPGTKLISLGNTTWEEMRASYAEQAGGLIDGGADAFLIETCQDLLQVKCVIDACLGALRERGRGPEDVPILASITIETTGTMLLGTELAAAVNALSMFPIASIGLNCATGPAEMADHLAWLSRHWDRTISVVPNAGLPALVEGRTEYPLGPGPFVESMMRFVDEFGVGIVGGCCGTTTEHIRALAQAVGDLARPRPAR